MNNITHRIIAMDLQSRVTDDLLGLQYVNAFPDGLKFYARSLTFLHDTRCAEHPHAVCMRQGNTDSALSCSES
jgi:hypothetical protein